MMGKVIWVWQAITTDNVVKRRKVLKNLSPLTDRRPCWRGSGSPLTVKMCIMSSLNGLTVGLDARQVIAGSAP